MPVVQVQMFEGRTVEQKRALAEAITEAMVTHAGARREGLHVLLDEYPLESWARGGVLASDRQDP